MNRWRCAAVVGCACQLAACSPSLLVRPDDASYGRARERLAHTAELVQREAPPEDERWTFLQAEAFFRYRFEPPPRSVLAYAAQTAAIAIELPALQAVAGSLDLMDLRLRSYDAAVQLWETLLAQHPATKLRRLTLWRLGWAYRSAGANGLPRESGDEAWDALAAEAPGDPLAALAREAKQTPWKSKGTATGLSIVPGLGQMYVKEWGNGAARLAIALVAVTAIVLPAVVAYNRRDDLSWGRDWPLLASAFGGVIVLSVDYTTAYQDAVRGVVQWNERSEAAFLNAHPDAP